MASYVQPPSSKQAQAPKKESAGTTSSTSSPSPQRAALAGHDFDAQVQMIAPGGSCDPGGGRVQQQAQAGVQGAGAALPHLGTIQRAFGSHDVSQVQAYTGGAAARSAGAMGATAYATGSKVAFSGGPDLHTAAHEAAHVVQQRAGVSLPGGVGSVGDSHEQHADAVADAVVQGKSAEPLLDRYGAAGNHATSVQKRSVQAKEAAPAKPSWKACVSEVLDAARPDWKKFIKDISALSQGKRQRALLRLRSKGKWDALLGGLGADEVALIQGWLTEDTKHADEDSLKKGIKKAKNSKRAKTALTAINGMLAADAAKRVTSRLKELLVLGVALPKGKDSRLSEGVLSVAQAKRAVTALINMPLKEYARVSMLLELTGSHSRMQQSFLLLKATAARVGEFTSAKALMGTTGDLEDLEKFSDKTRGMKKDKLIKSTSVTATSRKDRGMRQKYTDSCGPTALQVIDAEADPVKALRMRQNRELGVGAVGSKAAQDQKTALERHQGQTAVPRQRASILKKLVKAIKKGKMTAGEKGALRKYLNNQAFDNGKFTSGRTKLKAILGSKYPGDAALEDIRDSAGMAGSAGLLQGELNTEGNTGMDVDATTGTTFQTNWDAQLWTLFSNANRNLTKVNLAAWRARVRTLLQTVYTKVEAGADIVILVQWEGVGGGGHYMTVTNVRKVKGKNQYLVHDPWSGKTEWVKEKEITSGNYTKLSFPNKALLISSHG